MPTEMDFMPSHMVCAKCGKLMRLVAIEPSEAVLGADEITYRCPFCDHEEKRIRKVDNR
jgi:Zn finger protein HypA/HybF involved in hydrogenase expression